MSRFQSDFSVRKDAIDQIFRPYEPPKRVKRLYVPENVNDMDRVFSEYDWNNQTYTTTLRSIPQHRRSIYPQVGPSEFTVDSRNSDRQTAQEEKDEASNSFSRIMSRHNSRAVPDETHISSYLLSSSPPSTVDDASRSNNYPSSPIAQSDTLSSPLQQSIMANAELEREFHLPQSPSARAAKQLRDYRPGQLLHGKRPRSDSCKTMVDGDQPSTSSIRNLAPTRRNRSCTWSSDATAVEASEDGDKSSICEANYYEMENEMANSVSSELWSVREGEEFRSWMLRRRRPSVQPYSGFGFDEIDEDLSAEEEVEEEETHKETRLNHIMSAIQYRYVSVGLRVQLAVHRTEKKVARKLSDRRKS